jgi:predicted deacylase
MNKRFLPVCLALALPVSCALPEKGTLIAEPFCEADGLQFHTDFEAAALHGCAAAEDGPVLTIAPEFAPINPSPWYAWRVTTAPDSSGKPGEVSIRQRYLHGWHRYHPWISLDGEHWERLPNRRVSVLEGGSVLMHLDLPPEGLYVAAQPPLTTSTMDRWFRDLASGHGLDSRSVAQSVGGRAVTAYQTPVSVQQGSLVMISRQHPPEVTGGLAYQEFVGRLFAEDGLARRFREHFAIGLVPEVNPDGVARGHWRTNQRGVDLNRDWGPFTQPETRGVARWMAQLNERTPLRLFIDFHSTSYDVLYMPHRDDDPAPTGFSEAWRANLSRRLGEDMPAWSGDHNPGLPTSKTWVRKEYGVVAMTYEVGDDTPRDRIREVAVVAAEEMMKLMLEIGLPET